MGSSPAGRRARDTGIGTSVERAPSRSAASPAWRRYRRDLPAVAALIVLVIMVSMALGAGLISEHITHHADRAEHPRALPASQRPGTSSAPTSSAGTSFTRLLYGARVSLGIAGLSIAVALLIGTAYGVISGYVGGLTDGAMMRIVDVLLSVPSLFLLLLIASLWRMGPLSLAFVIAATSWVTLSRLVRGEVLAPAGASLSKRRGLPGAAAAGDDSPSCRTSCRSSSSGPAWPCRG